jgi:uncharacterized membrane protein
MAGIGSILLFLSFTIISTLINFSVNLDGLFTIFMQLIVCASGAILVLIGVKGLAKYYKDDKMYKKIRTGVIFVIIGSVMRVLSSWWIALQIIIPYLSGSYVYYYDWWYRISLLAVVPLLVGMLVMVLYFRKTFKVLAIRSGKQLFSVAGTIMLIGAILTAVFLLFGLITNFDIKLYICWPFVGVAFLVVAMAFFTLKATPSAPLYYSPPSPIMQPPYPTNTAPESSAPMEPSPPPPIMQPSYSTATNASVVYLEAKFCPYCGAPVKPATVFCAQCGKRHKPEYANNL